MAYPGLQQGHDKVVRIAQGAQDAGEGLLGEGNNNFHVLERSFWWQGTEWSGAEKVVRESGG